MDYLNEVDKILANTMMNLVQTAAKDGIITKEEKALLDTFDFSLNEFKNVLVEAFEDGIITPDEKEKLEQFKEAIIEKGRKVAEIDEINVDEFNLLIAVMCSLKLPKSE
ncbi:MAG: hypothetical protein OEZ01_01985 [Candidatus Heimdallarchaeota archaeon]|nr:hypothetical protein [Candidatus Heimdallarchaeota archaeon]MDH5644744.1 hypothetical protein [Candidatus Heimdallarchaeota archaeon]